MILQNVHTAAMHFSYFQFVTFLEMFFSRLGRLLQFHSVRDVLGVCVFCVILGNVALFALPNINTVAIQQFHCTAEINALCMFGLDVFFGGFRTQISLVQGSTAVEKRFVCLQMRKMYMHRILYTLIHILISVCFENKVHCTCTSPWPFQVKSSSLSSVAR